MYPSTGFLQSLLFFHPQEIEPGTMHVLQNLLALQGMDTVEQYLLPGAG